MVNREAINYLEVIANNIKRLRGRMSQKDLAKKAGIGKSTVNAIEQGRPISLEKLLKIAETLGVHPGDLLLSEEDKTEATYRFKKLMEKFTK